MFLTIRDEAVPVELLSEEMQGLVQAIGVEATQKLVAYAGGNAVYVANGKTIVQQLQNKRLLDDWRNGLSVPQLARKYKLSTVRVYDLVKKRNDPPPRNHK